MRKSRNIFCRRRYPYLMMLFPLLYNTGDFRAKEIGACRFIFRGVRADDRQVLGLIKNVRPFTSERTLFHFRGSENRFRGFSAFTRSP